MPKAALPGILGHPQQKTGSQIGEPETHRQRLTLLFTRKLKPDFGIPGFASPATVLVPGLERGTCGSNHIFAECLNFRLDGS
jgi:hypothetical protein